MIVPLWLRYGLPALGAVLALWAAYDWAHDRGRDGERAKWQAREVAAQEAQRAREAAMQAQVAAAGAALSVSTSEIERLTSAARVTTRNYYVQNPAANVACLLPDRLRAIADSDEAAQAAGPSR